MPTRKRSTPGRTKTEKKSPERSEAKTIAPNAVDAPAPHLIARVESLRAAIDASEARTERLVRSIAADLGPRPDTGPPPNFRSRTPRPDARMAPSACVDVAAALKRGWTRESLAAALAAGDVRGFVTLGDRWPLRSHWPDGAYDWQAEWADLYRLPPREAAALLTTDSRTMTVLARAGKAKAAAGVTLWVPPHLPPLAVGDLRLPIAELGPGEAPEGVKSLRPDQQAREECRRKARRVWQEDHEQDRRPSRSAHVAKTLREPGQPGAPYTVRVVTDWIRDLNPAPRRGRDPKNPPQ